MSQEEKYTIPGNKCLQHCSKLAITQDKPLLLDYWTASLDGNIIIGVRDNDEKLLVKNEEEYTSPIEKIYKIENEYIILTENSIYIVSSKILTRKIS